MNYVPKTASANPLFNLLASGRHEAAPLNLWRLLPDAGSDEKRACTDTRLPLQGTSTTVEQAPTAVQQALTGVEQTVTDVHRMSTEIHFA